MTTRTPSAGDGRVIVIVGGVAAGASAATRARRCNEAATIIMLEQDEHVSFANCGLPYYVGGEIERRDALLVASPERFASRFNIDVRTRHRVTAVDTAARLVRGAHEQTSEPFELRYDRLVLAPGAAPIMPAIDRIDAPNVVSVRSLGDTDRLRALVEDGGVRRAAIVGGGFIGLEMAEQLHRRGVACAIIERSEHVLPPLDDDLSGLVERELRANGVELRLGTSITGVRTASGRACGVEVDRAEPVAADLVIMGIGVRPNTAFLAGSGVDVDDAGAILVDEYQRTGLRGVYAAGDAAVYRHGVTGSPTRMPLGGPANRAGRLAGEHAATGSARPMRPVLGTAIVRVFGVTAGVTGLGLDAARRTGLDARASLVVGAHHAGYYPGAEPMHLKLVYDAGGPQRGRVLGAQAVGGAGVDKRIDVLATAISLGATVDDVAGLDLAYAPPFGAAKDPVHMAAFVAGNDLDGSDRLEPSDADLDGAQLLDVRTADERETSLIEGSVWVPIDELRRRLDEQGVIAGLDPAAQTVTVCRSGQRAHVASRLLRQRGFADVRTLTGGLLARSLARPDDMTTS